MEENVVYEPISALAKERYGFKPVHLWGLLIAIKGFIMVADTIKDKFREDS